MFFYTGVSNQMYKDKYIKKRDQKLTGCLNNKKNYFSKLVKNYVKTPKFFS